MIKKLRKLSMVLIMMVGALLVVGCSAATDSTDSKDGTYEGIGQGKGGDIKVAVTIDLNNSYF